MVRLTTTWRRCAATPLNGAPVILLILTSSTSAPISCSNTSLEGALKQDSPNSSRDVIAKPTDEDEEFAHMMARMDELEKEEREAESQITPCDEDEQVQHGLHQLSDQKSLHGNLKISEVTTKAMQQTNFIHKAPK